LAWSSRGRRKLRPCYDPIANQVALKLRDGDTSFNLHGEPIVCSAVDALDTFARSGLPHLALGRFLISKR
jgi:Carbamoyltransferase C-terminus